MTETEAALDGIEQHVAIGDNDDAHVNEENCENERPHVGDATQLENGPNQLLLQSSIYCLSWGSYFESSGDLC